MSDESEAARMTGASTTREEVERLACLVYPPGVASDRELKEAAATLRALLDERDALASDCLIQVATENAARHLAETERDAARAEVARMREAGLDALASLCAALDLLKRGGKKAAPSDRMFEQMLKDYAASIERARAALAGAPCHE